MKLKPCPFCGSQNIKIEEAFYDIWPKCTDDSRKVVCMNCFASGPIKNLSDVTGDSNIEEAAAKAWNRRDGEGEL